MVIIRFSDPQMEVRALGYLALNFSCKTWANGDTMVPEEALAPLAKEGFEFTVAGRPSYERHYAPLRDSAPTAA